LVGKELLEKLSKGVLLDLAHHDFHHLLAELLLLGSLSVASSLDLVTVATGESNSEHADKVTISGLSLNEGLDKGVPLLDEGAELIAGDVHTVEVGVAIEALDLLDLDLDLSPCNLMSVVVELTKGDGEDTVTEGLSSDLLTGCLVTGGKSGDSDVEDRGNVNVVPFLLVESMDTNQKKRLFHVDQTAKVTLKR